MWNAYRDLKRAYVKNKQFEPESDCYIEAKRLADLWLSSPPGNKLLSICLRGRLRTSERPGVTIYIVGTLDLRDGHGADATPLPPFIATHCRFVKTIPQALPGSATGELADVEAARSHLTRLSLRGSHFGRLRANNCIIEGDCDLSTEIGGDADGARRDRERCQVRLDGAKIGGSLYVSGRLFRELSAEEHARQKEQLSPPYYRNCALDLNNASIGRDLQAVGSHCRGLFNARGVRVDGNIRMVAVTMRRVVTGRSDRSGTAIDLKYALVAGNVSCRASQSPPARSRVNGGIVLQSARVGGDVILEEGDFSGLTSAAMAERRVAIDARSAQVGGNLRIGLDRDETGPLRVTTVDGAILLDHTVVGGNLTFDRVHPPAATVGRCHVQAHGILVKQRMTVRMCTFAADRANTGIRYAAIDFWRSTIESGVKVDQHSRIDGSIRFNNSVLSRGVILRPEFIGDCGPHDASTAAGVASRIDDEERESDIETRVDLSNSTVDGDLRINSVPAPDAAVGSRSRIVIDGAITLDRTSVSGRTVIENVHFVYRPLQNYLEDRLTPVERDWIEANRLERNARTILNLNTFQARGGLIVRNLSWEVSRAGPACVTPLTDRAKRNRIRLLRSESRLGRKLRFLNGWALARDVVLRADLATIDARAMRCAFLNDGHGAEWNLHVGLRLRMDQIEVDRVELDDAHHRGRNVPHRGGNVPRSTVAPPPAPEKMSLDDRIRMLERSPYKIPVEMRNPAMKRLIFIAHQASRVSILQTGNQTWFVWWRNRSFVGQSYDSFARAYIRRGDLATGRRLLIRKTDVEVWRKVRDIFLRKDRWRVVKEWNAGGWAPVKAGFTLCVVAFSALLGVPVAMALAAYRWMFGYGLRWERAVLSFAACLVLGTWGAHVAKTGHWWMTPLRLEGGGGLPPDIALVKSIEERPAVTLGLRDTVSRGPPGTGQRKPDRVTFRRDAQVTLGSSERPCDVDSLSFAVDAFIPLIDMDMAPKCQIRDDPDPTDRLDPYFRWRIALLLYELAGWIVVSLTILTISGVIRRDVDK